MVDILGGQTDWSAYAGSVFFPAIGLESPDGGLLIKSLLHDVLETVYGGSMIHSGFLV